MLTPDGKMDLCVQSYHWSPHPRLLIHTQLFLSYLLQRDKLKKLSSYSLLWETWFLLLVTFCNSTGMGYNVPLGKLFCRSHSFVCLLCTSSILIKTILSLAGDVFHSWDGCSNFSAFCQTLKHSSQGQQGASMWALIIEKSLQNHCFLYTNSFILDLFPSSLCWDWWLLNLKWWLFLYLWMVSKQNTRDLNQQVNIAHNRLHYRPHKYLLDLKFC